MDVPPKTFHLLVLTEISRGVRADSFVAATDQLVVSSRRREWPPNRHLKRLMKQKVCCWLTETREERQDLFQQGSSSAPSPPLPGKQLLETVKDFSFAFSSLVSSHVQIWWLQSTSFFIYILFVTCCLFKGRFRVVLSLFFWNVFITFYVHPANRSSKKNLHQWKHTLSIKTRYTIKYKKIHKICYSYRHPTTASSTNHSTGQPACGLKCKMQKNKFLSKFEKTASVFPTI